MRKLYLIAMVSMLAACSSHRYQANFPSINSYLGYERGQTVVKPVGATPVQSETLVASTNTEVAPIVVATPATTAKVLESVRKTYLQMDKAERKELRKQLKAEMKNYSKNSAPAASKAAGIDHDLKLAAVFGAVGIVALLIAGDVFTVIGAIAMIIGVVFFIKWLVRQ